VAHLLSFFDVLGLSASTLSDLGCRSEKSVERGQILPDLQRQYRDIDQKAGEIGAAQVILQPTIPKPDRLLEIQFSLARYNSAMFMRLSFISHVEH
jgi:hypothetical protein